MPTKLSLLLFICSCAADVPQVYQPTYEYGATPMGVYVGDPYQMDDDVYLPNGETMHEYQTQSGEQEQSFQYIQGQEDLMADHSRQALAQYKQEQVIGESMQQQYWRQIDPHTTPPPAIVLPTM